MSALGDIYIKVETLEQMVKAAKAKDMKGVGITFSIQNETNDYGQNVSAYVSQTKEEREAEKKRYYVGNGKVFWTDGSISVAEKKEQKKTKITSEEEESDLPF